jgi:anion-transporting  ArsA/GET3 family ATPase
VIVNGLIPREVCNIENPSPYVLNKLKEQEGYLETIHKKFPGLVRAYIPLYESEVIGIEMIEKVAKALAEGLRT